MEGTFRYEYTVEPDYSGTVQGYLRRKRSYSVSLIRSLKVNGVLRVNGAQSFFTAKVGPGDGISVDLAVEKASFPLWDRKISVIHEDDDIIIINKDPGIVVHPTKGFQENTLANAVYGRWALTGFEGIIRFVNRIDMDTSGIVVGAKNRHAHAFIQKLISTDECEKTYLAIARGHLSGSGVIRAPIGRVEHEARREVMEGAKDALTSYDVIGEFADASLLRIRLSSGRTHQIRVHLSHIGHPVIGDTLYSEPSPLIPRQALHAFSVSFPHPRTGRRVAFEAPMPQDMASAVILLREGAKP